MFFYYVFYVPILIRKVHKIFQGEKGLSVIAQERERRNKVYGGAGKVSGTTAEDCSGLGEVRSL